MKDFAKFQFAPKGGGGDWIASLETTPQGSGFDVVLFLDQKKPTEDSGWMLELAVLPDGQISGQITAHPGYDALALFDCTQDTLSITANDDGPVYVISDNPETPTEAVTGADSVWVATETTYSEEAAAPNTTTLLFRKRSEALKQMYQWALGFYSGTDDPEDSAKGAREEIDTLPHDGGPVLLGHGHSLELHREVVR